MFGSTIEGLSMIFGARSSIKRVGTKFIPKNAKAKNALNNATTDEFSNITFDKDPVTDQYLRSVARDQKALDDLGKHYLSDDPTFSSAKIGRDDVFDANETAVRPRDVDGVPGAAVDAARISDNIDTTYGRQGAIQSESDLLKSISPEELANRQATKAVAKTIREVGAFSAELPSGKIVTENQIENAGVRLAEIINDPRMVPGELKLMLDEFKKVGDYGSKKLDAIGKKAVTKSIATLTDEFFDMDMEKARAYLVTANAGQISDIAEGARLMEGTTAVARAQDRILDRLQYLMVEKKLATAQNGLRRTHLNAFKEAVQTGDPKNIGDTVDIIKNDIDSKLLQIIPETKKYIDTLRGIKDDAPQFLKSFRLANELTDGEVDTLYKTHLFMQNKTGVLSKLFIDNNPKQASIFIRTQFSILFNSLLTSLHTLVKAGYGNAGGILAKPTTVFTGGLLKGDLNTLRRASHQYFSVGDSFQKGFDHLKVVYRKSATNPTKVSYIMRDDIALKEIEEMKFMQEYAQAMDDVGEPGGKVMLSLWEQQQQLAEHPWLRFGPNGMGALDGFNRAMYATAEAKGRAFDAIMESGQPLTKETLQEASDKIYKTFFDENGMIVDSAVDFATRESALNLDSGVVDGINTMVKKFPILRSIFWFPRTMANRIDLFRKWSPIDALGYKGQFEGDFRAFTKMDYDDMDGEEVARLLRSKGIDPTKNPEVEFRNKAAEYRGRVAMGTVALTGGLLMAVNGRIRGNGHWDPTVMIDRRSKGWQQKTIQLWDGKWYSYEFLGPIGDLLAVSVDLVDNFDSISTGIFEEMQYKLAFILGASIYDKSLVAQMEPLTDILSGNPAAHKRWVANMANTWMPFGGQRRDLSKILSPMLREYDAEVGDLIRNRNNFLDIFDPDGKLPYRYNFITGKPIGRPENMWVRFNNAYNEIKQSEDQTEEEKFLMEIEYNSKPYFTSSPGGVEYDKHQRADLYSKMGEMGYFANEVTLIMKDAEKLTYTDDRGTTYKGFVSIMKAIRRGNISSKVLDHEKYAYIFPRINKALADAKRLAEESLRGTGRFVHVDSAEVFLERKLGLTEQGQINDVITLEEEYNNLQNTLQSR